MSESRRRKYRFRSFGSATRVWFRGPGFAPLRRAVSAKGRAKGGRSKLRETASRHAYLCYGREPEPPLPSPESGEAGRGVAVGRRPETGTGTGRPGPRGAGDRSGPRENYHRSPVPVPVPVRYRSGTKYIVVLSFMAVIFMSYLFIMNRRSRTRYMRNSYLFSRSQNSMREPS